MIQANTVTLEADPEVARCEEALRAAARARDEACKRAADPGEMIGQARWKRLPLSEAEATRIKSDANYAVRQAERALDLARRPKLSVSAATSALAAAEGQLAEAIEQLARINADMDSSDPRRKLRALDADRDGGARAVTRGRIAVDLANEDLRAAEVRERDQRLPLFEIRNRAIAKRIDQQLDALAEIVTEAVELHDQAWTAGIRVERAAYVGALRECVEEWRGGGEGAGRAGGGGRAGGRGGSGVWWLRGRLCVAFVCV